MLSEDSFNAPLSDFGQSQDATGSSFEPWQVSDGRSDSFPLRKSAKVTSEYMESTNPRAHHEAPINSQNSELNHNGQVTTSDLKSKLRKASNAILSTVTFTKASKGSKAFDSYVSVSQDIISVYGKFALIICSIVITMNNTVNINRRR